MRSSRTFISSRLLNLNVALTVVFLHVHVALLHLYISSEWDDISSSYDVLKIEDRPNLWGGCMGSDQLAKAPKMRTRRGRPWYGPDKRDLVHYSLRLSFISPPAGFPPCVLFAIHLSWQTNSSLGQPAFVAGLRVGMAWMDVGLVVGVDAETTNRFKFK
eukprot:scaffold17124_cov70-Skeletonema_dohrnii-CCMP3373.AAC.1